MMQIYGKHSTPTNIPYKKYKAGWSILGPHIITQLRGKVMAKIINKKIGY
jgi:hypothetical protein